ncbi:MAG: hypothetical protein AVDCRST_MAG77-1594, partial [uncultured Chloroflexi bacterium]
HRRPQRRGRALGRVGDEHHRERPRRQPPVLLPHRRRRHRHARAGSPPYQPARRWPARHRWRMGRQRGHPKRGV